MAGKYKSKKVTYCGMVFDSKKEKDRFCKLEAMQARGEISGLQRQYKIELIPAQRIGGKCVERACNYFADFAYYDSSGVFIVEDVKSKATKTPQYIIKRKLILWLHGIQISEV